ncbi:MAG: hypothetical protein ILP09_00520, partial [Oscillospiraceae bacterium]|nr:hypothetical protein [Oscillospiraceae bacterium]
AVFQRKLTVKYRRRNGESKMKKALSLLLALVLAFGIASSAFATSEEEQFRAAAEQAVRSMQEELDLGGMNISEDTVSEVMGQLMGDPELFWFESYARWKTGGRVIKLEFFYREGVTPADIAVFDAAVDEALKCVLPGMDELQTALVLHDYLALHVAYDHDNYVGGTIPELSYTAYGALVTGVAVCQGYAQAYRLLLSRCGIDSVYISSDSMNHGWTAIRLGGQWYHVDVTWDDPAPDTPGFVSHRFFLLSDETISDAEHEHNGWSPDIGCGSDIYEEGMFWEDLDAPIPFTDADTYWSLEASGNHADQTISLIRRSWSGGETRTAASVKDYWPVWQQPGGYWVGAFSGLVLWDSRLFFNDKLRVYAYDPAEDSLDTVYTYDGGDGYIYGLTGDGTTVSCLIKQDPNQSEGTLHAIPLTPKYPSAGGETPAAEPLFDVSVNGLVQYGSEWIYVVNGAWDSSYTGLIQNDYGWWCVYQGRLAGWYTGLFANDFGIWYIYDGRVADCYSGLVQTDYGWWYVYNGRLADWYTGLIQNDYGWWYIYNGQLADQYTGLVQTDYGWWYVYNGRLADWYTGLIQNDYGWWCIYNGQLADGYTGLFATDYGWWYIYGGQVASWYTGLVQNDYGWWYVYEGQLADWFSGYVQNEYGWWYVYNGQLVF